MAADYDLSRRVTLAEYERRAREIFALLDTDHDGKLTRAELPQPPQNNRRVSRRRR